MKCSSFSGQHTRAVSGLQAVAWRTRGRSPRVSGGGQGATRRGPARGSRESRLSLGSWVSQGGASSV